jgi:hypothetical protein
MGDLLFGQLGKYPVAAMGLFGLLIAYLIWAGAKRETRDRAFLDRLDRRHDEATRRREEIDKARIETDKLLAANLAGNTEVIRSKSYGRANER